MLYQYHHPVRGLRVVLVFLSNGLLAIVPAGQVLCTLDNSTDGVTALFSQDTISFFNDEEEVHLNYGTTYNYRQLPLLLRWLQGQRLLLEETPFA